MRRACTLLSLRRGSNPSNFIHARHAHQDPWFCYSSIAFEASPMISKSYYRGCELTSGSFSTLEPKHLHCTFPLFEVATLVNDEDEEPLG